MHLGYLIDMHAEAEAGPASSLWEPKPIAEVCIPPEYSKLGVFGLRFSGDSMDPLIKRGAFMGVDSEDLHERRYLRDLHALPRADS